MEKVKKLSNTNTHEAKQISKEGSIIIADTIEEFRYAYTRMRALELRAERRPFVDVSAEKFDLDLLKHLTAEEKNMINNEMEDEVRSGSWLNEAESHLSSSTTWTIPEHTISPDT